MATHDEEAELKQTIQQAHKRLFALKKAECLKQNADVVGKCFRFRNSYSCPKTSADYWWLYIQVVAIDDDGDLVYWSFEQDQFDRVSIVPNHTFPNISDSDSYEEISAEYFWSRWCSILEELCTFHKKYSEYGGEYGTDSQD